MGSSILPKLFTKKFLTQKEKHIFHKLFVFCHESLKWVETYQKKQSWDRINSTFISVHWALIYSWTALIQCAATPHWPLVQSFSMVAWSLLVANYEMPPHSLGAWGPAKNANLVHRGPPIWTIRRGQENVGPYIFYLIQETEFSFNIIIFRPDNS